MDHLTFCSLTCLLAAVGFGLAGCSGALEANDQTTPHTNTPPPETPPQCGASDGVCPGGCTGAWDADCTEACRSEESWPANAKALEIELLSLVNESRNLSMDCRAEGEMGPSAVATISPVLQEVARCHAVDMGDFVGLTHTGSNGQEYPARAASAGFTGTPIEELGGQSWNAASDVFEAWMASDEHCRKLMNPAAIQVGMGYYETDADTWWVLLTASP